MTFNYFDNSSFIGKKQTLGINNLNSINHNNVAAPAGARWVTPGEYNFVVPTGVTQVSAVAVGGGGGGSCSTASSNGNSGGGGGGGALSYGTFSVTPGETLTITVGAGGTGGTNAGLNDATDGEQSKIMRGGTNLILAGKGTKGTYNVTSGTGVSGGSSIGTERDGGGNGGRGGAGSNGNTGGGGGGAGGYSGNGGNGGSNGGGVAPQNGAGGGGGGGVGANSYVADVTWGGGGVGIFGEGNNGGKALGSNGLGQYTSYGTSASNGQGGAGSTGTTTSNGSVNKTFGGGGSGAEDDSGNDGAAGGGGAVRIIWGFIEGVDSRSYPSTNTAENLQDSNDSIDTGTTSPTYGYSYYGGGVNEGSIFYITINTTNVANGTTLYFVNSRPSDFPNSSDSGSFTINNNTGTIGVVPTADNTTEGTEYFNIAVKTGSTSGPTVLTTGNIAINDTSTGGGGGKIICTALNQMYGFGSFRNKIWMKYNNYEKALYPSNSKILELGYHKVFGKLTEMMPSSPLLTKILRRIARVRTDRIRREMSGKPLTFESKLYTMILRPIVYLVGWLVHKKILKKYSKRIL